MVETSEAAQADQESDHVNSNVVADDNEVTRHPNGGSSRRSHAHSGRRANRHIDADGRANGRYAVGYQYQDQDGHDESTLGQPAANGYNQGQAIRSFDGNGNVVYGYFGAAAHGHDHGGETMLVDGQDVQHNQGLPGDGTPSSSPKDMPDEHQAENSHL
jgi:hypothetical protein